MVNIKVYGNLGDFGFGLFQEAIPNPCTQVLHILTKLKITLNANLTSPCGYHNDAILSTDSAGRLNTYPVGLDLA